MSNLILYHFESCQFCQKVRRFIQEHRITGIIEKDVRLDSVARDELVTIGGKSQVPCLVVDGVALYESNEIINWLTDEFVD